MNAAESNVLNTYFGVSIFINYFFTSAADFPYEIMLNPHYSSAYSDIKTSFQDMKTIFTRLDKLFMPI